MEQTKKTERKKKKEEKRKAHLNERTRIHIERESMAVYVVSKRMKNHSFFQPETNIHRHQCVEKKKMKQQQPKITKKIYIGKMSVEKKNKNH